MSLVSRLIGLVSDAAGPIEHDDQPSDGALAVAALLIHVARVDGIVAAPERRRMADLLRERLGLSDTAASRLLVRGDALDRETDDIADLIEMMGHGVALAERRGLLAMAYEVAAADGGVGEFEEDLVWRVGRLLGLSETDIASARAGATRSTAARTA